MVLFITSADSVWFYSVGLAVLAWISIGALPALLPSRALGTGLAILAIVIFATSTLAQNYSYVSGLPDRVADKEQTLEDWRSTAQALEASGAQVVYGAYADALPIGYVSNWKLRTITNKYNRFPMTDAELNSATYVVAVRQDGAPGEGEDALAYVQSVCQIVQVDLVLAAGTYTIAECPTSLLADPAGP
jgi:hypothetical protein